MPSTMNSSIFDNTERIANKMPYPQKAADETAETEELIGFAETGDGCLTHLLAMISDCLYHHELDDDFADGDMKMAYLTMKKAWESGGDTKPFLATMSRNRKALCWANIALIWLMVLDRNNDYWAKVDKDFPDQMPEAQKERVAKVMGYFKKFREEWKELHEAKRLTSMMVSYGKDGFHISLYGTKMAKAADEDPTA